MCVAAAQPPSSSLRAPSAPLARLTPPHLQHTPTRYTTLLLLRAVMPLPSQTIIYPRETSLALLAQARGAGSPNATLFPSE